MKQLWQIVRKDLYRLRLPLALWTLLIVARLGFQALISGLWGQPRLELLGYWGEGPLVLVRTAIDPVMVYLLAGWLVFEDPLVERDAFWITRPISGARLLGAKLISAGLIFLALPVFLTLPWWLGCGLGLRDIGVAVAFLVSPIVMVATFGMACAVLTDGFPRYLLWTVVSIASVVLMMLLAAWLLVSDSANGGSGGLFIMRVGLGMYAVIAVSLIVIFHQYLTRRLRRSIILLVACGIVAGGAVNRWTWDPFKWSPVDSERAGDEKIKLKTAGNAYYDPKSKAVVLPLIVEGLPRGTNARVQLKGDWMSGGVPAWTKSADFEYPDFSRTQAMRQLLDLPGGLTVVHKWSALQPSVLTERMKRESPSFHATADILLLPGALEVAMDLREQTTRNAVGSFSISDVQRNGDTVRLTLTTRRLAYGRGAYFPWGDWPVLFKRANGALCLMKNEGAAYSLLDSVLVRAQRMEFTLPPGNGALEDMVLAQAVFQADRVLKRTLDIDPFILGQDVPAPPPKP